MIETKLKFAADFFDEEEKCGFFITRKRKEVWAIELDLLHEFDQVCRKHGLRYYLDAGTLLGAIRHEGFIPWDDDVDVCMLRADYDRLLEIAPRAFRHPYFFQHAYTDMHYFRGHAQLRNSMTCGALSDEFLSVRFNQGIFIDIFVLDAVTDDPDQLNRQERELDYYQRVMERFANETMPRPLAIKLPNGNNFRFENLMHAFGIFETCLTRFELEPTRFVTELGLFRKAREDRLIERSWLGEPREARFENLTLPIPSDADSILRRYYGADYMTPINKSPVHAPVLFDTDRSYSEVLASLYI